MLSLYQRDYRSYTILFPLASANPPDGFNSHIDAEVFFLVKNLHQQRSEVMSWPTSVRRSFLGKQMEIAKEEMAAAAKVGKAP